MEIKIESQIGTCEEFKSKPDAEEEAVSIVISPLKVVSDGEEGLKVVSGCNMWQACQNRRCHFSAGARRLPKVGQRPK